MLGRSSGLGWGAQAAPLPAGWVAEYDATFDLPYYVSPKGESQWERPEPASSGSGGSAADAPAARSARRSVRPSGAPPMRNTMLGRQSLAGSVAWGAPGEEAAAAAAAEPALPPGFTAELDGDGNIYYVAPDGTSSWTRPEEDA